MNVTKTKLAGVLIITPKRFSDARGWFCESYNKARMNDAGLDYNFIQDNHSFSAPKETLRGLHYQSPPHAQDKLVRCTRGMIFDVAVDIRKGSPTYGQWIGEKISAEDGRQILIPKGFAHGFLTLEDNTEIQYKCTENYAPQSDGSIKWDSVGINWGSDAPLLSDKDAKAPPFDTWQTPFVYGEF